MIYIKNKVYLQKIVNDDPNHETEGVARELLEPLVRLAAALDAADRCSAGPPLERAGLLEDLLDPEVQAALPAALRAAADAYLDGLPGYRAGDIARAGDQHRLRLDLWSGEAMPVGEDEIEALGLEEAPENG